MNFPTIFEWLERLEFLRGFPAAYLTLLTAFFIVVVWDWRVMVFALAVQYFAAGLLVVDVLDPRLAVIKILVGWFICLMFYMTARQSNWGHLPEDVTSEEVLQIQQEQQVKLGPYMVPGIALFRVFLALMVTLVVLALSQRPIYQLPAVSEPMNMAIFALGGMGLIGMSLTTEPLKAGIGLLMFMTGFELFYNTLEQSVAMLAFLAGGNLVLALIISYLTQMRHALPALFQQE